MNQASAGKAWGNASRVIGKAIQTTLKGVRQEVATRAYRASNELRNASTIVLRGQRSGRVYKISGTYGAKMSKATKGMMGAYGHKLRGGVLYRASAPGEPPAVRTGMFRLSWGTHVHVENVGTHFRAVSAIESSLRSGKHLLGDLLEDGSPGGQLKPRPYKQAIRDRAMPEIQALYRKPYKV